MDSWVMSLPSSVILPLDSLLQAGQAVDELGLAVALDARQTDDLARVHLEATHP